MPLTQIQKANLVGGIGNDFARAFNPNILSWKDIGLGKQPSNELVLGGKMVTMPVTTMRDVQSAPGEYIPTPDAGELVPGITTPPTYEKRPVTENVTQDFNQWKANFGVEGLNQDVIKKKMENEIMANRAEQRGKVSGLIESKSIKAGGVDTARGFALKLASLFALDPDSKSDDMMKWVNDFEKGDSAILSGFANFTTALKQKGYDLSDPDVKREATIVGSPVYNAMKEITYMLSKQFKPFENEETGITTFYYTEGDKLVKVPGSEIKTSLSAKEKLAQEKEKISFAAKTAAQHREPKETPQEASAKAVAVKKATSNILTPTEKREAAKDVADAYSKVMKYKEDPGLRGEAAYWNDHTTSGKELVFKDDKWTLQPKEKSKGFTWKNGKLVPN